MSWIEEGGENGKSYFIAWQCNTNRKNRQSGDGEKIGFKECLMQ